MGQGKNLSSTAQRAAEKRLAEQAEEIKNQELVEMATAAKIWPEPSTKLKTLTKLRDQRLLKGHRLGKWKEPGEHRILSLQPGEIILFVPFIRHGLNLPACPFFHGLLHYYSITLNHLNPNSFLHLSVFVHLCETFLGIPSSITLFYYFSRQKPHPNAMKPHVLGGADIQFCTGKKSEYFDYTLVDSVKD
jgi:hypothetical protein